MVISNVVPKAKLREIQLKTLDELSSYLVQSFGPMGSNSLIKLDKAKNKYTKDGHTILGNIRYNGIIEMAIQEDIEDITRHIVKTIGDGTTSAVILSNLIFKELEKIEEDCGVTPYDLVYIFKKMTKEIVRYIKEAGRECTVDDIYNIAYISTNGNKKIAGNISDIYAQYGMNVFIDVAISNSIDSLLKTYDGMTLNTGYCDSCFINTPKDNLSSIRNAKLYVFEDPIDTPEMCAFLDKIIANNILAAYEKQDINLMVPTVILAPKISRDMSTYMEQVATFMAGLDVNQKPKLNIITNIYQAEQFLDIAKLAGAKLIKKYIDPKIQAKDIENGLAPTLDTVCDFAGFVEHVESSSTKTKFINPKLMYGEDGEYSDTFKGLVAFLEAELEKAKRDGADNNVTGNLKRRINSLKANLVEYLVGGITVADRDSTRDLVEDAVLNCRSAAQNGVGYAGNFEGFRAAKDKVFQYVSLQENVEEDRKNIEFRVCNAIYNAYKELMKVLYRNFEDPAAIAQGYEDGVYKVPVDVLTGEENPKILTSIESDKIILESISRIVTIMLTSNQAIVPTPTFNIYIEPEKTEIISEKAE